MTEKKPTPLLRITCNNCFAIIGENKEPCEPRQYSFGLWACCGSTPNSAFTLNVLNADEVTHLRESNGVYHFVNSPSGMTRNGKLVDGYEWHLTYETIYNTGRAELYVDHRRVGAVWLSHQDGEPYFCLHNVLVYLKEIDKEDEWLGGDY